MLRYTSDSADRTMKCTVRRGCPVVAIWLLLYFASVQTQHAAQELDTFSVLTTCLNSSKALVESNGLMQYIRMPTVKQLRNQMCAWTILIARDGNLSAASEYSTSFARIERRLLFRIDQLLIERPMQEAAECNNISSINLGVGLSKFARPWCHSTADRYVWLNDSLSIIILPYSSNPIIWINATFASLPAINACDAGMQGTAVLEVQGVVYLYAPDEFYDELLTTSSKCELHRNYSVYARAANASQLVRVTVLASPNATLDECRRLYVQWSGFHADDLNTSVQPVENVTIIYEVKGMCGLRLERRGFTLKLESVSLALCHNTTACNVTFPVGSHRPHISYESPATLGHVSSWITSSPPAVNSSPVDVPTLVVTLVVVLIVTLVIVAIVVVTARTLRRRDRLPGDGAHGVEIDMIDNELYCAAGE